MKFHIYGRLFKPSLFYEKTSCGHGYPGKIIYETEKEPELPHDIIKTYELELKNDFTVFEDGVKVGNWTNVYDQSFIVNYKNSVFYRFAIVLAFFLGMVLTPPDPMSQLLMAIPLILLYEVSIWGVYFKEVCSGERASRRAGPAGPAQGTNDGETA